MFALIRTSLPGLPGLTRTCSYQDFISLPRGRLIKSLHAGGRLEESSYRTDEPQALASQLVLNSQIRSRPTRQDPDLSLPRVNTDAGERRLLVHTEKLYNSLPRAMHNTTLSTFKCEIRTL